VLRQRGAEPIIPRSGSCTTGPRSVIPMPRLAGKWRSTRTRPPAARRSAGPLRLPLAWSSIKPEPAARHQGHPPRNTRPV